MVVVEGGPVVVLVGEAGGTTLVPVVCASTVGLCVRTGAAAAGAVVDVVVVEDVEPTPSDRGRTYVLVGDQASRARHRLHVERTIGGPTPRRFHQQCNQRERDSEDHPPVRSPSRRPSLQRVRRFGSRTRHWHTIRTRHSARVSRRRRRAVAGHGRVACRARVARARSCSRARRCCNPARVARRGVAPPRDPFPRSAS